MKDTERQARSLRHIQRADGAHHLPSHALTSYDDRATECPSWHQSIVQQLLDAVTSPIAVCDEAGVILLCNAAWLALDGTFARFHPGESLLQLDSGAAPSTFPNARELIAELRSVLDGKLECFSLECANADRDGSGKFNVCGRAIRDGKLVRVMLTTEKICGHQIDLDNVPEDVAAEIASLSNRERQILDLVLAGEPNKLIASHLDLSQKTVEKHRSNLMRKLGAQNVVHLVRKVLGH